MPSTLQIFRVTLQVSDLAAAAAFYTKLLGSRGRRIHGARHYFDCGAVILALLDPTEGRTRPKPMPDYIYFAAQNVELIHDRARRLECLEKGKIHGDNAGSIVVRPWGERSFYARDPFGNRLCFVDAKTLFRG
jgi:catechol 2,3-dioxygenase-like lactoylglutathione lyase family enzyme